MIGRRMSVARQVVHYNERMIMVTLTDIVVLSSEIY